MHNLRHFYYQNKEQIWKVVLFIAFLLGIIYFLNYLAGQESSQNISNEVQQNNSSAYIDNENKTYISDKSSISGSEVTENQVQKINSTINKFLQYCKNGNIEEAYNMLSADCKENEYKTLDVFKQRYINLKFTNADIFEIENWLNNTYKIIISEDILATGNLNTEKQVEYITIVKEDSVDKLNINSYIGKNEIKKENTYNQVKISVLSKKVYMDYEEYEFKVENLSNKTIKLDSLENAGTMYLQSSSKSTYNSYAHELYHEDLEIRAKQSIVINVKYAKAYSNEVEIKKIVFNNLILDYAKYKRKDGTFTNEDLCKFIIDI